MKAVPAFLSTLRQGHLVSIKHKWVKRVCGEVVVGVHV